ncbi:MAG: hypothetical protein AMXMBFR56_65570 [Polyangiaceae bacterium]
MQPNEHSPSGDAIEYSAIAADKDLTTASPACRAARRIDVTSTATGTWLTVEFEKNPGVFRGLKVVAPWHLEAQIRTIKASANGAVAQSGAGPVVTITGTPLMPGSGLITITLGGARGVATFNWSFGGQSGVGVATAATVALGTTGLTANFPVGTYVLNETYAWSSTATNVDRLTASF